MEIPAAAGRRNRVEKDSATLREIDWNTRHGLPTVGRLALLKLFHRACLPQAGVLGLFLANFHCIFFKCNRTRNNYFTEPQARFISTLFPLYFYSISTLLFLSLLEYIVLRLFTAGRLLEIHRKYSVIYHKISIVYLLKIQFITILPSEFLKN
jgi:hypothetical protein